MLRADAPQRGADAGLHIAGKVEVHQAVGGEDLHFGIVIAGWPAISGSRLARRADFGDLLDGFEAHRGIRVLQQVLEFGDGAGAGLGHLADIFGTHILGRQKRRRNQAGAPGE